MPLVPLTVHDSAASGSVLWDGSTAVSTRPMAGADGQLLIDTVTHRPVAYASAGAWVEMESQRTYVGAGDFDSSKLTAAENWGMPTGTVPDPVVNPPAPNDIYINTHSGSITTFN